MEEATQTSSRRGLLGRTFALAAGAVGVSAAQRIAQANAAPPATTLVLYGRGLHLQSTGRRPGSVPTVGERATAYGELLDQAGGRVIGHFSSAFLTLDSPFAPPGSLELHTLTLEHGTIHGLGSVATGADGHYAILGGTGRYAGARGTYVASENIRELGGDGTAEFRLTFGG
jgi:hypothetical protein